MDPYTTTGRLVWVLLWAAWPISTLIAAALLEALFAAVAGFGHALAPICRAGSVVTKQALHEAPAVRRGRTMLFLPARQAQKGAFRRTRTGAGGAGAAEKAN